MTRQTKIIIGVVAGVLILCLAICVVGGLFINTLGKNIAADAKPDPDKAAQTAADIADFTPPEGYQPMTGMKILGYTIVVYTKEGSASDFLMLMQIPGLNEMNDTTIQQMQQAIERQGRGNLDNKRVIDTRDLTIRGKPARAIVQEGTTKGGSETVRQLMVAFQGKGGVAMLMLTASAAEWDQASIDQMIESIR